MSGQQTVAGAYAKIEGHEELCAERYKTINDKLETLFTLIWRAVLGLIAVLFTAAVGVGVQLWQVEVMHAQAPQQTNVNVQGVAK
jgi:hypothetical protein